MPKKSTLEEFIAKARAVHGDRYDYSMVKYVNGTTSVCIKCPVHGEFMQAPKLHLKYGCRKCGRVACSEKRKDSFETFVMKARKVHGDRYGYERLRTDGSENYRGSYEPMDIYCPVHGTFCQAPHDHLKGSGCPKCGRENTVQSRRMTNEEFIRRATETHGGKYSYEKTDMDGRDTDGKVIIKCTVHGYFRQNPHDHIKGQGCPKCAARKMSEKKKITAEEFEERASRIHDGKYSYTGVYYGSDVRVPIVCPVHGTFLQTPHDHLEGAGCPVCGGLTSHAEEDISAMCEEALGKENVKRRRRNILDGGRELDIYLPTIGYAIEYNGLRWHSEEFGKDCRYHIGKTEECLRKGIRLIQVFEDEYECHRDAVMSKIRHILGMDRSLPKIMGRKCSVREISPNEAKRFLDEYHIQGYAGSTVRIGAFNDDVLVAVMTFRKERNGGNAWELNRLASDSRYICQGVGGKLFAYFVRNYGPEEVKSFADRRWTVDEENNIYAKLGFIFDRYTEPDYRYYIGTNAVRYHKFGFRKERLHARYGLPLSMTEKEMTESLGYSRIWDCGLIKYVWRKKESDEIADTSVS